jgi:putative glycosyltransferase
MVKLRIVSTVFNSESTIMHFLEALNSAVAIPEVDLPVKVHLVNDGSKDSSLSLLLLAQQPNLDIRVLDLARNYGHHQAIFAGIKDLDDNFDLLVIIDSDLEENPNEIESLIEIIQNTEVDIVVTYQKKRKQALQYKILAKLADLILRLVIGPSFIPGICTLRVMKKHVALQLQGNREDYPVLGMAQQRLGLSTKKVAIQKSYKGSTEYTFYKRVRLFIQILSNAPDIYRRIAFFLGLIGISVSIFSSFWLLFSRITTPNILPGFTSVMLLITLFGGILTFLSSLIVTLLMKLIGNSIGGSGVVLKSQYEG